MLRAGFFGIMIELCGRGRFRLVVCRFIYVFQLLCVGRFGPVRECEIFFVVKAWRASLASELSQKQKMFLLYLS